MIGKKSVLGGLFCLLLINASLIWGQGARSVPIDVYLIVDGSSAMERGKDEAVSWLCTTVIDGMLQNGDRIWVWSAGEKPELVYSGSDREAAKTAIRAIRFQGNRADYRGALAEARAKAGGGRVSYALLVSGSGAKDPPTREAESAGLLRYSRVENFSGWRVLTVGLDVDSKVQEASSYYMDHSGN
ncbi:hypothetical protein AGMMS50230_02750 [Spirochaetia bacterium]|nr:hypothetical protein AGMMS50230_02750 [Spirochaetia bacterium]